MGKLLQSAHSVKWAIVSVFLLVSLACQSMSAGMGLPAEDLETLSTFYIMRSPSADMAAEGPSDGATFVTTYASKEEEILRYRELAITFANDGDAVSAARYVEKYITSSLDVSFVEDEAFRELINTEAFSEVREKYCPNYSALNLFYLFSALIGLFIGVILNIKKTRNRSSNLLISGFVLIHSIFILHIFLYLTNLKFQVPHILFMSTIFSFLYGPLIYFYVKRIAQQYTFRKSDALHLIPSVIIALIYIPIYLLPAEDKLKIMLQVGSVNATDYVTYTFLAKLFSLLIYGYFLVQIYRQSIWNNKRLPRQAIAWQKTIIGLGMIYIVSYMIYGLIVSRVIPRIEFLYHLQVVAMALMVLYIGFKAYLEPRLFTAELFQGKSNKYRKSGLTPVHSLELKERLVYLLEEEKVYRENDINLERIAQMLQTSRHNASQVINEHFNLSFFDLINKFRISEATEILRNDTHSNLNIIDVAYEVGFNNKVTFNKSFKKNLAQTPTQYLLSLGR